ncbi:hypothetical protein QPK13_11825 [Photorhabdus tasmaniensis]|jgi:hypothetical protein|uniref:hypothetical protein n=1 Tax=Photorhabdus sp. RM323S TaxID=3342828 RepID=UPI0036DA0917
MPTTISQKAARDLLGTPEYFEGGVFVSRNGKAELFIQTASDREAELARQKEDEQINAMLKLVALSQKDVENGDVMTPEELLAERKAARSV